MGNGKDSQHSWAVKYVKLLGWFSSSFMLITVLMAGGSTFLYIRKAEAIEGITHRNLAQGWVIFLLWIPLFLQIAVLFFLFRVWKQKSNYTIDHYFKFYFKRTFVSSFTYVLLWLLYIIFGGDQDAVYALGWVSLGFITLLISFVVQATYLITRTSFRNGERLFTEEDIENKHECICKKLAAVSLNAQNRSVIGQRSGIELIHEWLLKDRDYKVHRVAYKGTITDLDIPHLLEALNRLVCSRRFYSQHNGKKGTDEPLSSIEEENRKYIEKNLLNPCEPLPANVQEDKQSQTWEFILSVISLVKKKVGMRLGKQSRADKRIGERSGIVMFPFYTMIFFFSIFLCIAYLFGFAFAFEDKYVQLSKTKPPVALFMTDDLLEDVGKYSTPTPTPTPAVYKLNDLQKVFYFNASAAGIATDTSSITDGNFTDREREQMQHIARINKSSLDSLVDAIKTGLMQNGENIRVELVGRADDNPTAKVTYASNYEIAAARIHNVHFLLQQALIERDVPPKNLSSIEWVESPFSNDGTLTPKVRQGNERSKINLVLDNEIKPGKKTGPTLPIRVVSSDLIDLITRERMQSTESIQAGDRNWQDEYRGFLKRLEALARNNVITQEIAQKIYDHIREWNGNKAKIQADIQAGNGNRLKAEIEKANNLRDDIDAELYQFEDPSGRKRAVEVYLFNAAPPAQEAGNNPNPQPNFKRMALMDYLYFAMYTITTTGYGDIKPMTTYSKFLCTLANMTEFFFIVVFFNTLLSLRQRKEEAA